MVYVKGGVLEILALQVLTFQVFGDRKERDRPLEKWWGVEKKKKKKVMQGRETEKRIVQRKSEKKIESCRMNITVGLTNCAHLNGYLAATLITLQLQF